MTQFLFYVVVTTCTGKKAAIYSDKRLTLPMQNPILSYSNGSLPRFYTSRNSCIEIAVLRDNPPFWGRDCYREGDREMGPVPVVSEGPVSEPLVCREGKWVHDAAGAAERGW